MSISQRIRQSVSISPSRKYFAKRETSRSQQQHYLDYYTFTDAPQKKSKMVKGKKKKNYSSEKNIGSIHDHSQSLQKLQIAVDNRNKKIIQLVQETSKLKSENTLMKGQLEIARNLKQIEYLKQMKQLEEELERLKKSEEEIDKKNKIKLEKLYQEKTNNEVMMKQLKIKRKKKMI